MENNNLKTITKEDLQSINGGGSIVVGAAIACGVATIVSAL